MTKQSVITEALKLTEAERLEVAETLCDSLDASTDASVDQAWADEIRSRLTAIDSGEVTLLDWAEVKQQLREPGNGNAAD